MDNQHVTDKQNLFAFMAMLIFAFASFSIATEPLSELFCFDCKKVVEKKTSLLALCRPKSIIRKVTEDAASAASNKISCYQAGKRMN